MTANRKYAEERDAREQARTGGGPGEDSARVGAVNWPRIRIGTICESTAVEDPQSRSSFHYVDISAIDRLMRPIAAIPAIEGSAAPSRARKVIRAGDVLVSTVRPNLNAVAVVPEHLDGEIASTGFCVLRRDRDHLSGRYLYYYCCTPAFIAALAGKVRGAQYPAVSDDDVRNVRIPLPPLSEQRRIVEILDQADRLRRLRAEADAKADRILPAVLAGAIGSSSTWPSDPRSRTLGVLVDPVSGATPSKTNRDYWNGGVPWVSPKDMKRDFLSDAQDHVSQLALDQTNLRVVEPDNVLIVVRGMILARDVPVALNLIPVTINQDMKALVPKTGAVTGSYVWAALRLAKASLQSLIRTAGHGTRKLDTPELMQFPVVVPSPGQLARVDSVVHQHRHLLDQRHAGRSLVDGLFGLLLGRAFDGSLTRSWREAHMTELLQEMEHQARARGFHLGSRETCETVFPSSTSAFSASMTVRPLEATGRFCVAFSTR